MSAQAKALKEARSIIRALLSPAQHGYAASSYRTGKWRHIACSRCAIEERADRFLQSAPESPKP